MKKSSLLLFFVLFCLLACVVPPATNGNSASVKGKIIDVVAGSSFDVVLKLEGDDRMYYINRGLENGLTIEGLRKDLLQKEVLLKYADMAIDLGTYHIYEVQGEEGILYTEMAGNT